MMILNEMSTLQDFAPFIAALREKGIEHPDNHQAFARATKNLPGNILGKKFPVHEGLAGSASLDFYQAVTLMQSATLLYRVAPDKLRLTFDARFTNRHLNDPEMAAAARELVEAYLAEFSR